MYTLFIIGLVISISKVGAHLNKEWQVLGCYKDSHDDRALKNFLGRVKSRSPSRIFEECRKKAQSRGLVYLGIQNKNQCWGSEEDGAYDKHGCSQNCVFPNTRKVPHGVGKQSANFVYYRNPGWSSCKCGDTTQYKLVLVETNGANCPLYNRKVIQESSTTKSCSKKMIQQRCTVDGQWSRYGPWSACDQVCGHNGKQIRFRTCTEPKPSNGGKDCVGSSQKTRNCANCPKPCSFDGILIQLLNSLQLTISVNNNHLVGAFSQVMEAMENADSKQSASDLSNELIFKKIKRLLLSTENSQRKIKHARKFLGLLLARQKTCNYAEISKELKDEIGNDGLKRLLNVDGKVTLTFVMDVSRSMKSVIPEVTRIVKRIARYNISNADFVLSTFPHNQKGNKGIVKVKHFDTLDKFIKGLEKLAYSDYYKEKKGDCSEPTYAGIIKAIVLGDPQRGSPMYVFTDAPPRAYGEFTEDNAIYLAQKNKIPVNIFVSKPFCAERAKSEYENIAEATGGFASSFRKDSNMKKVDEGIKSSLDGTTIVSGNTKSTNRRQKPKRGIRVDDTGFYIDDIAQEGTIEIEAKGAVKEGIHLFNPNNGQRHPERVESNNLFWTILRPMRGRWNFISAANLQFGVKSLAKLDITLEWKFMRKDTIIDRPLIGEKAKVKITIPNISRLDKTTLSLSDDWKLLSHDDNFYIYESMLPLTDKHLKIPVSGKTLSGVEFTRESVNIQPKIAVIRSLMDPWFSPSPSKKFTYKASIDYAKNKPQTIKYKFDDDDDYKTKTIYKGENRISRDLTAPSDRGHLIVKIKIKSDNTEINFKDEIEVDQ